MIGFITFTSGFLICVFLFLTTITHPEKNESHVATGQTRLLTQVEGSCPSLHWGALRVFSQGSCWWCLRTTCASRRSCQFTTYRATFVKHRMGWNTSCRVLPSMWKTFLQPRVDRNCRTDEQNETNSHTRSSNMNRMLGWTKHLYTTAARRDYQAFMELKWGAGLTYYIYKYSILFPTAASTTSLLGSNTSYVTPL